jgi:hypothetical protein
MEKEEKMYSRNRDYDLRTDIGLIGCLTDAELFNGSTCSRAVKAPRDPSLLDAYNILPDPKGRPHHWANLFCQKMADEIAEMHSRRDVQ